MLIITNPNSVSNFQTFLDCTIFGRNTSNLDTELNARFHYIEVYLNDVSMVTVARRRNYFCT